jgi:hypothetical protein
MWPLSVRCWLAEIMTAYIHQRPYTTSARRRRRRRGGVIVSALVCVMSCCCGWCDALLLAVAVACDWLSQRRAAVRALEHDAAVRLQVMET